MSLVGPKCDIARLLQVESVHLSILDLMLPRRQRRNKPEPEATTPIAAKEAPSNWGCNAPRRFELTTLVEKKDKTARL
jgi:hypothetical protein